MTVSYYVGWGGIASAFDERNQQWSKEYEELKELLTEEEYRAARATVNNAFYTSPEIASCIGSILYIRNEVRRVPSFWNVQVRCMVG